MPQIPLTPCTDSVHQTPDDSEGPIDVLITGFGPFGATVDNPSWLAARQLDGEILTERPPPLSRRQARLKTRLPCFARDDKTPPTEAYEEPWHDEKGHFKETGEGSGSGGRRTKVAVTAAHIPVTYDAVLGSIPPLYGLPSSSTAKEERSAEIAESSSRSPIPDIPHKDYKVLIHVGVAGGRIVRLEEEGHRFGYNNADFDGLLAPKFAGRDGGHPIRGYPGPEWDLGDKDGILKGNVDTVKLESWLRDEFNVKSLRRSQDAGHYLCDFIYYGSLASSLRAAREDQSRTRPYVLFVHVPNLGTPYSAEELASILRGIVWAIVNEL